jgi:hypothetical protein
MALGIAANRCRDQPMAVARTTTAILDLEFRLQSMVASYGQGSIPSPRVQRTRLSAVGRRPSAVCCRLSAVGCLLSAVCCLL